ncbi:MAG: FmdB family zinc ribbon protein [Anaerolineaceae bacterium]
MPVYEYICLNCKKRFDVRLAYDEYGGKIILCSHCSSDQVRRKISRLRVKRSEGSRLADLPDPASLEGLENDPQSLGRMIRSMSKETGEDLGPDFNEVVDRLESGQSPGEIEKSLPDLADGDDTSSLSDED